MSSLTILEVVLENFMSYEYARVPLSRGLNLICGPNGAGKSSILIAISVATGQSYTERSRKLADLIRRGKDTARVTLVLDNRAENGKRPSPLHKQRHHISLKVSEEGWDLLVRDKRQAGK
ncbi:MAG: hypothetical protein DSO08_03435 [Candidatus Methanomethylicota archaeon]|uniref:Rad50/SbcC-type AAA domain-containing protein n=1 Tax=Thermoproteota archaeon TaxID=2056631 RepID=A0A523BDD0_9CREN|nr:MAG: hypothetical protein DSO08_03435 [Candidatus Verstraetearchaeota archaeon]